MALMRVSGSLQWSAAELVEWQEKEEGSRRGGAAALGVWVGGCSCIRQGKDVLLPAPCISLALLEKRAPEPQQQQEQLISSHLSISFLQRSIASGLMLSRIQGWLQSRSSVRVARNTSGSLTFVMSSK